MRTSVRVSEGGTFGDHERTIWVIPPPPALDYVQGLLGISITRSVRQLRIRRDATCCVFERIRFDIHCNVLVVVTREDLRQDLRRRPFRHLQHTPRPSCDLNKSELTLKNGVKLILDALPLPLCDFGCLLLRQTTRTDRPSDNPGTHGWPH